MYVLCGKRKKVIMITFSLKVTSFLNSNTPYFVKFSGPKLICFCFKSDASSGKNTVRCLFYLTKNNRSTGSV